jgi:hypothetical protein
MSYGELQRAISRHLHGREWQTYRIPKWMAKMGAAVQNRLDPDAFIRPWMIDRADDHYPLDISGARTLLGWEPQHSLRKVLPVMLDHLKADPERWYRENKLEAPAKVRRSQRNAEAVQAAAGPGR